jgi:hypothetical protein
LAQQKKDLHDVAARGLGVIRGFVAPPRAETVREVGQAPTLRSAEGL